MRSNLISEIRDNLQRHSDPYLRESCQRFSKHPLQVYGVRTPIVRKIGKTYWKEISQRKNKEIWKYCNTLWRSCYQKETPIACIWSEKLGERFELNDIRVFEMWIDYYVSNWAQSDALYNHPAVNLHPNVSRPN